MAGDARTPTPETTERIAKRIARAGVCSRRDAEKLINEGRVTVNGTAITSPALNVTATDKITVNGTELRAAEATRLFRLHKRKGCITSARDPEGRATIYDHLPANLPRLMTIGRLDYNTEGLLLMTNDGALARALELPATGWTRRYRVRVFGYVDEAALAKLAKGITVDGIRYGAIEAALESRKGDNAWLSFAIREGKNREVRKVLTHLGLTVNRLIRVAFGPFQLGALGPGMIEEVPRKVLGEQCGKLIPGNNDPITGTARARPRPPRRHARAKKSAKAPAKKPKGRNNAHHRRTP